MRTKVYIFLCFYFLALISPLITMIDYAVHQEKIAKYFCENKDKPQLKCGGKCYLTKKLKAQRSNKESDDLFHGKIEYPIGKVQKINFNPLLPFYLEREELFFEENLNKGHPKLFKLPPII